jgi:hypothetical protein
LTGRFRRFFARLGRDAAGGEMPPDNQRMIVVE